MTDTLLGFARLAQLFDVEPVQPLAVSSRLGSVRQELHIDGHTRKTWPAAYQPQDNLRGHFEFGLKYERIHLEFFSRLFAKVDPEDLARWVRDAPTGQYARRTAFLFEWLTGKSLSAPDATQGGYIDAISADAYLVARQPTRNRRWRVNDNLPGTRDFCPTVFLGNTSERSWIYDVRAGVQALDDSFGPELLMRCAAWLTFKESRGSFLIEHEADREDRVKRFAAVIAQHSGNLHDPLSDESLAMLQSAVLGDSALRVGIRQSPVFVGQSSFTTPVVHYIAPGPDHVRPMLAGLRAFELRTRGADSVVRGAALSFAFVYLHPLADGNGRVHRFLINNTLACDGAAPKNLVIPVSATISGSARGLADYDDALETFSKPFMQRYADSYRFGPKRVSPDGVESDLYFDPNAEADALHAWRYLDLTGQTHYMSAVLRDTVDHGMTEEALYLRRHDTARAAIKNVIEMPDTDADRIIRSLAGSGWGVSGKLRKEYPDIFEPTGRLAGRAAALVDAVHQVFDEQRDAADAEAADEHASDLPNRSQG